MHLMRLPELVQLILPNRRTRTVNLSFLAIAIIALVDWSVKPNIGLGFLYLFPILVVAGYLSRPQIVATTLICALLRELFSPAQHDLGSIPRTVLLWVGFSAVGLFMRESRLREDAQHQLHALIESSPAAILTVAVDGPIELSNQAAHKLLGANGDLRGKSIHRYIPDIATIQNQLGSSNALRTSVECRGLRENGQFFLGQLWMSRFDTLSGPRFAVIISDASEQLRDREEIGLEQSLSNSRLLVSAVSHEIRNLSSAAAIAHTNLARVPAMEGNSDFSSLGLLIDGLRRVASAELTPSSKAALEGLQLKTILDDLRIVLQSAAGDAETMLEWHLPDDLPPVRADRQGLFQVCLNLSRNSFRAMRESASRVLAISSEVDRDAVRIRFRDTGTGVGRPDQLFRLFRSGSNSTGIGLYISKAILRSYGGDLRHEPTASGACFVIELPRSAGSAR
jgi:two-component system, LuxR family, sensor kinase FixL